MKINGCDCSIVIKTTHCEKDIPYSDETLREAVSLLEEEAAIEGDGCCRAIRKNTGVTGCIITPLTIGTAPLLLCLAMGSAGKPVFVSETRELYKYTLNLLPLEDTDLFDLVQDRGEERRFFEGCRIKGFELRIMRDEALKLKLEIYGERNPITYHYGDTCEKENGERFSGDGVTYKINGQEYNNIYGVTLTSKKEGGTRTELWIKRALGEGSDLPQIIDEIAIKALLFRNKYEHRHYGTFNITLKRLVLTSDETNINSSDTVIGPLRYYVADTVTTEVFTSNESAFI
jgi:hypothetical protein